MKNLIEEVDRYAQNAVSGQDGNKTAFGVACKLWRNSSVASEVETAFNHYNATKCVPPFAPSLVKKMLDNAYRLVGSEVGKYDTRQTKVPNQTTKPNQSTEPNQTVEIRPKQAQDNTWLLMATRLLNKCQDDFSLNRDDHKWLEYTRGIDSIFAYGVGVGYCVGKEGHDYRLSGKLFGIQDETISIYAGYTVPIRNEVGDLVGVIFIRPNQQKSWRYMVLSGSLLLPFGVEWLRYKSENGRIVIIVEGTINYLSLLQAIGGHHVYDKKVVILGLPNANVYPDSGTLSLLKPNDTVVLLTDNDTAGERCKEKWSKAVATVGTNCVAVEYKKSEAKIDANDLLCSGDLWTWTHSKLTALHKMKEI